MDRVRGIAAVALCLIACGCGPSRPSSVRIDPALATLVPADTVLLAGIRVQEMRALPAFRSLAAIGPLAHAGISPNDVWEALVLSNGTRVLFLARGKFSSTGLEPEINRPGATRDAYNGYTLVSVEGTTLVFLNPTTVVAGTADDVKALLDVRGSSMGPTGRIASELAAIPEGTQIWAVGTTAAALLVPPVGNLRNIGTALRLTDRFHFGVDLRNGAQLRGGALCRNAEDAGSLTSAITASMAFARLTHPRLTPVAEALHVTNHEKTVTFEGKLPQDWITPFLGK